ncbi:hypothetical protein P43SY_001338 [Pythium insidiosum]|uniref:tRNA carboxymethyluridine synthase n=1 Tax=Pythium insidiosum TaxID=114742 RepID=A0AAD5L8M8_PYTIN|nr:hypothetical protein P43SY_001338 [Pythium insidiosum]
MDGDTTPTPTPTPTPPSPAAASQRSSAPAGLKSTKKPLRDGDINDPDTYKRSQDRDWKNNSIEDIYATWDKLIPADEMPFYQDMARFLVQQDPQTPRELEKAFIKLRRQFKCLPKKNQMKFVYNMLVQQGEAPAGMALEKMLVKKAQKSQSGIELLVLGGTWASYPHEYQESFIRDLFYAANTFYDREKRPRMSLDEEKQENERAAVKIIGITLETRPDCINAEELRRFRRYGCTRVQLGIQHTDDAILKKINRGCTTADAIRAMTLLRDCCYKTDVHLMPNLPGSDPEKDRAMFEYVLHSEDLQADQWKIYPCEITPWTVIKKWFDEGSYVPYDEETLIDLLMDVKAQVHPWIRLNRVIRDIPSQYILGGMDEPNLRQVINNRMLAKGTPCRCIRCREVKTDEDAIANAEMLVRHYRANGGDEYFISFEPPDQSKICGFVRLRLSPNAGAGIFPELEGAALVRELHVYGQLVVAGEKNKKAKQEAETGDNEDDGAKAQHIGFGTQLMLKAEELARQQGYRKIAVIAGVGVRNFYRRLGFEVEGDGELMIKHLTNEPHFVGLVKSMASNWTSVAIAGAVGVTAAAAVIALTLGRRR